MSRVVPSSILIDVSLPEPPEVPPPLVELVSSLKVVLVGWYEVPEQTAPEQARDQFAGEAMEALQRVAQPFRDAGGDVHTRLVFTGNPYDTISRIANEEDCDAVYVARPTHDMRRILVPLRGAPNAMSIASFVADLVQQHTTDVTLMHIMEEDEDEERIRNDVLGPVREHITAQGIDGGMLTDHVVATEDPGDVIMRLSESFDAVVLGETEPTIRDVLFGTVPERIATGANVPVIVVRHHESEDEPDA